MIEIRKQSGGVAGMAVTAEELREINRFAQAELTAEEVYTFAVRLCDNEVDRDHERFDEQCLKGLGELFIGKSGIFDHEWTAQGQMARIYRTEVIREEGEKTAAGDTYCWLKGWAYMLRTEKNEELIREIEGGIKKEVSVGCSVSKRTCSVCGSDKGCEHVPGKTYGGKLCYVTLSDPADAYEWSFVAVPAQKNAGVVRKGKQMMELKAWVERSGEEMLAKELQRLEKEANLGRNYLKGLREEVVRLAALADSDLDGAIFAGITERLEEQELLELKRVYQRRVDGAYPPGVQLGEKRGFNCSGGDAFLV